MSSINSNNPFPWLKTGQEIIGLGLNEIPTLIYPFFPRVGTVALAGSSDLGKSYFLLQAADAVINGKSEFLGFPLTVTHKSAIYLSTEDDDFGLSPRLRNLSKNVENPEVYQNLKIFYETKDLINRLDELLKAWPSDLVIIDTFSDIYDGDMNQANKVRSFLQQFKELAYKHKTLIIFNHHCGKKNDHRPPHKDNLLGSQGFESSMRTVIELRKDFSDPSKRHICIVKGNYIDEVFKNDSFVLSFSFQDGFVNTGERKNFNHLVKSEEIEQHRSLIETKIIAMRKQNLSITQISETLNNEGIKISRSTVGNICRDYRLSIQSSIEEKIDGQECDRNFEDKHPSIHISLDDEIDGQAA